MPPLAAVIFMKKFTDFIVTSMLPGEFDEGQGQYVVYRTIYDSYGHLMGLKRRILLGCLEGIVFICMMYLAFKPSAAETAESRGDSALSIEQMYMLLGILAFIIFCICALITLIRTFIFYKCERSIVRRDLSKYAYLDFIGISILMIALLICAVVLWSDMPLASMSLYAGSMLVFLRVANGSIKISQNIKYNKVDAL